MENSDCIMCDRRNSEDDMVQCDQCQKWSHYGCAGVDVSVADRNWECTACTELNATIKNNAQPVESGPAPTCTKSLTQRESNKAPSVVSSLSSCRSVASTTRSNRVLKIEMLRLEEQKKLDEKFLKERQKKEQEFLQKKFDIMAEAENNEADDGESAKSRTNRWVIASKAGSANVKQHIPTQANNNEVDDDERAAKSGTNNWVSASRAGNANAKHQIPEQQMGLTSTNNNSVVLESHHIAARQILARDLPVFSGRAEEWPLFISSYENTTKLCAFTEEENLWRLQKALRGSAMEAVGSRLLLPKTVPEAISTLRMLYGRPQFIVQTLLKRIRAEPPPKADRLDTIIKFALSIRGLHSTLVASELNSHLGDPILIQELVDKLPPQMKLNWAIECGSEERNLTAFSEWLFRIAEAASSVTTYAVADGKRTAHLQVHSQTNDRKQGRESQPKPRKGCYLCELDHKLIDCERFTQLSLDQRLELIQSKGICERCLGHPKRFRCRIERSCAVNGCNSKQHHSLLHRYMEHSSAPALFDGNNYCHHARQHSKGEHTLFSVVPVVLYGNGRSLRTYAFLDNGSSLTLVDEGVADSLGLDGEIKPLCLKWTSDTKRLEENSKVVSMEISGRGGSHQQLKHRLANVRTVKKLALPVQSVDKEELQKTYPHLCGLPIQSYTDAQCGILIGLNNQRLLLGQNIREGGWNDPVAIRTRLGWCVSGGSVSDSTVKGVYHLYEACDCNKDLHEIVRSHYALENYGIEKGNIDSADDIRAKAILKETVKREGNAFSTGLLWRFDSFVLPDSYPMAMKRLRCLEKRMTRDSTMLQMVNGQIHDLLEKGYARKLSQQELEEHQTMVWYLPTFLVKNHNKPNKVRLVWDAAASTEGISLNSVLLKGPDELRALTDVLFTFREKRVAITGDIQEMFHQVRVRSEDQHAQRFLWRNGESDRKPSVYVMQVLTFGATCSPSIAQHVKNKNAKEFANTYPRAVEAITNRHYVDDLLDSVDTVEEAIQLAQDVKYVHSRAGFNIRNWLSNSKEVLQALGQTGGTKLTIEEQPTQTKGVAKILGLWWDTEEDIFTFSLQFTNSNKDILSGQRMPTKRELLRVLMSIFDPLGFLSFYLVRLKVLLQDVWRSTCDWDEAIPPNLHSKWERWCYLLPGVENIQIQRCYVPHGFSKETSIQLHMFVDASEDAMAAVAYLRFKDGDAVNCVIVSAKSKVAPLKPLSIPRMELQAALMGSRLAKVIIKGHNLNIEKRFFWTDSRNVLCWLKADPKRFKQFVMFRVAEILETTSRKEWRWVPSKLNVADEATKWTKIPTFHKSDRWFQGPNFLYDNEESWPDASEVIEVQTEELRPQYLLLTDVVKVDPFTEFFLRFSTWKRLHRSMAWILRAVDIFKGRRNESFIGGEGLRTEELQRAERIIIRSTQQDRYGDELAMMKDGKSVPKSSQLFQCSPYLDDEGILRLRGRIDSAWCVDENTKRPIIMPKDHHVSLLIINHYHIRFHHRCQETVVNEVRQKFWVPRLRTLVKSVRRKCQYCRISRAVPAAPEMAPLPEARLAAYVRPFTYTGVDYFGPILISSGRRTEKRWGVLFTCLTIRAIHIEVAHSLTSDSCIMCVRNFMSRRGTPREMYSDNGTNLKGAEKELREAYHQMNKDAIQSKFTSADTKWYFNPPAAPHMGGCWERLIGSVKNVLKEVTRNQRLQEESLLSFLIEVEGIINSRPLTHVSVEADDEEALTPNHFLLGSSCGSKPPGKFDNRDLLLRKNWRVAQQLSDMFWRRWVREYLPTLTRRTKWFTQVRNVANGDVVIIVDENLPRASWPKGIVVSTVQAKDGQVRRATVRTADGVYDRPVVKLAVLDVSKSGEGETAAEAAASPGGRNVADRADRITL